MYPNRDTIPPLLPAPDVLLRLLTDSLKYITKHENKTEVNVVVVVVVVTVTNCFPRDHTLFKDIVSRVALSAFNFIKFVHYW